MTRSKHFQASPSGDELVDASHHAGEGLGRWNRVYVKPALLALGNIRTETLGGSAGSFESADPNNFRPS